ncbi:S-adenosyl-L-methionine-dependent methyltransferase [Xylariaceae sp. FL1272]|nr:S-adenosyl-L-methionine-dependent methyltransferase [Xylariaceae sp. FL1272]
MATESDSAMHTRIMELASRIMRNTSRINSYLLSHGLPTPSFDVDEPRDSMIPTGETDIQASRHDDLLSQQAITRYRVAHSFPVGQQTSFSEISKATGLEQSLVRRIVRHAIVRDIFSEPRPDVIVHNAVSRLLAEDQIMYDWVSINAGELWQAAAQTCNAWHKWPGSQEPNQTGFALANNTELSMYAELSRFPERSRRFGNSMRAYTQGTGFELHHVVENLPWDDYKKGTIVDVGGSQGFVSFAIVREFPLVSCVVQDLPSVIPEAEREAPDDLASRVSFMGYDFLTEQPVIGADMYLFRWIFHNWSDKYSIQILRNQIPALKDGAKIVIVDNILPEAGKLSRWQENRLRSMDLCMMEIQNSCERDVSDWIRLFRDADPRFKVQSTKQPLGSSLGFIVAEWKE